MAPKKKSKSSDKDPQQSKGNTSAKYEHPVLQPDRVDSRSVHAIIKLAAPVCPLLEFAVDIPPSTRVRELGERIVQRHGGSLKELSICVNRFHPEEILAPEKRLEDCGVVDGQCVVYYDFVPIGGPLLG